MESRIYRMAAQFILSSTGSVKFVKSSDIGSFSDMTFKQLQQIVLIGTLPISVDLNRKPIHVIIVFKIFTIYYGHVMRVLA